MAITHFMAALPTIPISVGSLSRLEPISFSVPLRKPMFRKLSIPAVSPVPRILCLQACEELPPKLKNIVELFQGLPETRSKFQQVLKYGKNLKPLAKEFKSKENKVEGCASQVWVRAFMDENKVYYEADSDSGLTRGVAALLIEGLSGCSPAQILGLTPDFIQMLGCTQRLTPSRNNGFLNTFKLIQMKALQVSMEAESADDSMEIQEQVLKYGKNLKPLAKEYKRKENKVEGCASQVWVRAFMDENKVYYEADSDSGLTRGVAALLIEGLSGCSPAQILGLTPDFIQMLGCTQRLTPSRNNGFLNTFKLIQMKALQVSMEAESADDSMEIKEVS